MKTKRMNIVTSQSEWDAWKKQSIEEGYLSLSEWIRDVLYQVVDEKPTEMLPASGDNNRIVKDLD